MEAPLVRTACSTVPTRAYITGTLFLEGLFIIAFPLWGYAVVSYVPGR